ncbi:S41 family peptidase [Hyphomonas pacifica]|uniref:Tail specific protease domain-containing protein n=1 Tax=Hyphomonas pacifica TaxID=1280941 RepID=A0A062TMX3_9PROT|nr:S41 family peptidase [Hyphomonas pacifica]KCZ45495.1 hypothetical protein HY2_06580 [Hyphomonas pacifica]RAN35667.1 hypothetical protein HY3_07550 [Hyphomonas pacifica]
MRLPSILLSLAFALFACAQAPAAPPEPETQLIAQNGTILPEAFGIWSSQESGWILEITSDGITRWQDTTAACYPARQDGPTLMGQIEYRYFTPLDADTAKFEYLPSDGHALFTRLEHMPARCSDTPIIDPVTLFEIFASVFQQHYVFFDQRGVDWQAITSKARGQISHDTSEEDLLSVFTEMLEPLQDSHTKLIATIDGTPHRIQFGLGETLPKVRASIGESPWLVGILDNLMAWLDEGAVQTGNERFIHGTVNGHIGYIQIFTMGGFTTAHEAGTPEWANDEIKALHNLFDEAFAGFDDTDALILDLSNNRGGYDAITRAIASRFLDAPIEAYSVRTEWEGTPLITYTIAPYSDGPVYIKPVYVITSDITVSGGEITTMMLQQLPHVTVAGRRTRGAFSTPLAKPLPNGWYLELSNEIFSSADGTVYEGRGIAPEIILPLFAENPPVESHLTSLKQLVACIEDETC